jgi:hypothetical protein
MMAYHTCWVWRSLDKGNAARLLFPQLYRVRTLTRPLWEPHGKASL